MIDPQFKGLSELAFDSRLGRGAASAAAIVGAAWNSSSIAGFLRAASRAARETPVTDSVRFVALVMVWASLGYLAALAVIPAYVAPGLPNYWIGFVTAAALVVAVVPARFAQAWPESFAWRVFHKSEP